MSAARLLLSLAELANRPGVRWLVDRKVQRGEISLLYADRGAGKSLFALAMALHVATGTPFLGRPVERGPVIYIALENTAALHARIQAWLEAHGMKAADLDGWFHVWNERQLRLQARDSEHVAALRETLQAMDTAPALIVIDTWARYTTGLKEKEESDMGLAIHTLDELRDQVGASFLIVHHSGKDSSKGARGSSALEAAATTVLHLKPGSGDQITVKCEKQNNGPDGWKHVLTLRQCREVESVALIDPESRLEDADASTGQDRNDGLDDAPLSVRLT